MVTSRFVRTVMRVGAFVALLAFMWPGGVVINAVDWPEHRGKGDLGVWNETGILETFPPAGLTARTESRWRR